MKYNINFENTQNGFPIEEASTLYACNQMFDWILAHTDIVNTSILQGYDFKTLAFDILICDNETIREVNRDYRQKDRETDVITFALFADAEPEMRFVLDGEINLGEIIVSAPKTQAQAVENHKTFLEEYYFLLSHGMLHMLGFDHLDDESFNFMMATQKEMIKGLDK